MTASPPVTLLTDFGLVDPYVASMKGVLTSHAPGVVVIDISHGVPPGDLLRGGLCWMQAVPYFPAGTVHVAVIDPGVGSTRRIAAVRARGAFFLAPDNGILGYVVGEGDIDEAVWVEQRSFFLPEVSATFHGRDILAPVAARIARGLDLSELGPPATSLTLHRVPAVTTRPTDGGETGELVIGEVLAVDSFGNCITNIVPGRSDVVVEVSAGSQVFPALLRYYHQAGPGEGLALVGSSGFLEIAVRDGRADRVLGLETGSAVEVRRKQVS